MNNKLNYQAFIKAAAEIIKEDLAKNSGPRK